MTKIFSGREARQGNWGRHVLIVLIAGLVLAIAAWGAVEFYGELIAADNPSTQSEPQAG